MNKTTNAPSFLSSLVSTLFGSPANATQITVSSTGGLLAALGL